MGKPDNADNIGLSATTAWYQLTVQEALSHLSSTPDGISNEEAAERLKKFGANQIESKKGDSALVIFLKQFKSPLIYILLFAAVISFLIGKEINSIVIFAVLSVNAVMGFVQESRASKVMESLKELSAPKAKVLRSGEVMEIATKDIVPGDVILLESGTKIPADGRVIESVRLQVSEAALTGESQPIYKITDVIKADTGIAGRQNMVFSGTVVGSGRGSAVVVETGMNTEIGKMAHIVQTTEETKTPFQIKMGKLGKFIIVVVLAQISLAFTIGYLVRGLPFYEIFMVALSQVVSSIPEGLPVAVTVALAVGMQRMAKRKAHIRKLVAVEGLGGVTVICSDKTGTLTRNEMTSKRIATLDQEMEVSGVGYNIDGAVMQGGKRVTVDEVYDIKMLFLIVTLCNNAHVRFSNEKDVRVDGDPTEIAYLIAALKAGMNLELIKRQFPWIDEIPFEPEIKMMVTKHRTPENKYIVCVKGSPEKILDFSGYCLRSSGTRAQLTADLREQMLKKSDAMAKDALRVLAFGFFETECANEKDFTIGSLKGKLTLAGLIGNIDPPRPEVKEAIKMCHSAGIRTIMVTGDHVSTAEAIGIELGIMGPQERGITGDEIEHMTDEMLKEKVRSTSIFARIEPKHKFRIVKTLQSLGEVVAMTGDGINDAPALAAADIGIAMGITGTDVAKDTSDMVIADDNFATIVNAVEEGRSITANMRKTLLYLLCSSSTEILVLLTALLASAYLPLLPLQILWINLVTDGALTVNLIMEPKEDVMNQKPDKKAESIVTRRLLKLLFFRAPIMAAGIITLFFYEITSGQSLIYSQTVAFTTLALTQWLNGINCRSEKKSIFKMPFLSNKYLISGLVIAFFLHLSILYIPFFQNIFSVVPLSIGDWIKIAIVGSTILWAEEIRKFFAARKFWN